MYIGRRRPRYLPSTPPVLWGVLYSQGPNGTTGAALISRAWQSTASRANLHEHINIAKTAT